MRLTHLHATAGDTPLGSPQFTRPDEHERKKLQRIFRRWLTLAALNGSQKLTNLDRFGNGRMVTNDDWRERAVKICSRIAFSTAGRDGIAEHFAAFGTYPMRRVVIPAFFNPTQGRQ